MTHHASHSFAERHRALYPGGRPSTRARAIQRRFVDGPLPRILPIACALEVRGRHSGRPVRLPLAIVPLGRSWYLVSMFGEQSSWVHNIRAADGRAILTHGRRRPVRLIELPSEDRVRVLKRYTLLAIGARPHLPVRWNDPLSRFAAVADCYPVFRVET